MRKNTLPWLLAFGLLFPVAGIAGDAPAEKQKAAPPPVAFDIEQSVIKQQLAEGVTADDAIDAMQSKAAELNMKIVAHQPLSKELQARGIDSGRLEIFQFCNPEDAHEMVRFNPVFAAYMPCRIALVEDTEGRFWVMMLNLDMLIDSTPLPPEIHEIAVRVNETLTTIINAAATGEF
jgi:uncharacterized protein (DUF302 family)